MKYEIEDERIYANDADDKLIAEITFPVRNGIATINHTFVDESLRGQGIADKLVRMAIDKIQSDGHKLAVTCRYAVLWIERHPEYYSKYRANN